MENKLQRLNAPEPLIDINAQIESINESSYNIKFVAMVLQGDKDIENGKGNKVTLKDLDDLCE